MATVFFVGKSRNVLFLWMQRRTFLTPVASFNTRQGIEYFNNVGNRRFRVIISMYLERYSLSQTKMEKSAIVTEVMGIIRGASGGFVKLEGEEWHEIGDVAAREKVSSCFRDHLPTQYRSSAQSKTAKRRRSKSKKLDAETILDIEEGPDVCISLFEDALPLPAPSVDFEESLREPSLADLLGTDDGVSCLIDGFFDYDDDGSC
jgi:hypothetical protein